MTEKALQQAVVEAAGYYKWLVYHTYDSRRSAPGFPDLCLVKGERLYFIEVKTEKGKLSEHQLVWLEALRVVPGVEVLVLRPAGLDQILELLAS